MPFYRILFISIANILLFPGCCSNEYRSLKVNDHEVFTNSSISVATEDDRTRKLSKFLKDTVQLDYLLNGILIPERMKIVCELRTIDLGNGWYEYKNGNYDYRLHVTGDDSFNDIINNSIFYDGKFKVEFKGNKILRSDPNSTENYGINQLTRLVDPRIVQVGTETFLYSPLTFNCNGIGCGIMTYFIYHLQTHKATFINDSHYYISKPLLGDFNLDGTPDILVIEDEYIPELKPFNISGYQVRLINFEFSNGSFTPKYNRAKKTSVSYTLTGLGVLDLRREFQNPVSITENNWYSRVNPM